MSVRKVNHPAGDPAERHVDGAARPELGPEAVLGRNALGTAGDIATHIDKIPERTASLARGMNRNWNAGVAAFRHLRGDDQADFVTSVIIAGVSGAKAITSAAEIAASLRGADLAPTGAIPGGGPKPALNFGPPTNAPKLPPTNIPAGWRVRIMPPTEQYPAGYWKLEKPMDNGGWQGIDPSTMWPGTHPEAHIPMPD